MFDGINLLNDYINKLVEQKQKSQNKVSLEAINILMLTRNFGTRKTIEYIHEYLDRDKPLGDSVSGEDIKSSVQCWLCEELFPRDYKLFCRILDEGGMMKMSAINPNMHACYHSECKYFKAVPNPEQRLKEWTKENIEK